MVRVRVPGCGVCGGLVQGSQVVPGLTSHTAEITPDVKGGAVHGYGMDVHPGGVGVPCGGVSRGGVEGGYKTARLAPDIAEGASRVHDGAVHGDIGDDMTGIGVEGVGVTRLLVQGGDVAPRLPAYAGELPPGIDKSPVHRDRPYRGAGGGVPCGSVAAALVQGGDVAVSPAADGGEIARGVHLGAAYRDVLYVIGSIRVPCRVQGPACRDVRDVISFHAAHSGEIAPDIPSPRAVGCRTLHVAVDPGIHRDRLPGGRVHGDSAARVGPDVVEVTPQVHRFPAHLYVPDLPVSYPGLGGSVRGQRRDADLPCRRGRRRHQGYHHEQHQRGAGRDDNFPVERYGCA